MPMGIVSDKDFDSELGKVSPKQEPKSIPNAKVIDIPTPGRNEGDVNVPNTLRRVIGETAITQGRGDALEIARQFGISPSSVSAYAQGSTSTATTDKTPNGDVIAKSRERITKVAMGKLKRALHHITDEKLSETKPRELAGIARDMSAVVKNMEEDNSNKAPQGNTGPTFVFYSPQFRKEEHFEVVHAKE